MTFKVMKMTKDDREGFVTIVKEIWGNHMIASQGKIFYPAEMEGLKAVEKDRNVGILHFQIPDKHCETLTLASLNEGQGVGTALLDALEVIAINSDCRKLCLSTTNDNLPALDFYQRRSYYISAVFPDQIKAYQKIKPAIPEIGEHSIPIRDEIRLEKNLA